jgi:soluble lytic murein transglycosylase
METEAVLEYDALEESASSSRERMLVTALALSEHGQVPQAMRLARKLVDMGEQDARVYRALYPLPDRDQLTSTAAARGLDPALVAGLIRQESGFNPRAVSVAGARGLMQVMPTVGESIARGLRFPVWYPVLLFDSDVSLDIGTSHLAASIKQHGVLPRVLAAYNAGGSRVARWSGRPGSADPELFAERIPFAETRDYVRIVARNADVYRALYARELSRSSPR